MEIKVFFGGFGVQVEHDVTVSSNDEGVVSSIVNLIVL